MSEKIIIRKYSNRRLYDSKNSVYITLSGIAEHIRHGNVVQVLDAKTKEDVTAPILTQVLLEEAKNRNMLLPVPLLHLLIQFAPHQLYEFFDKYVDSILRIYLTSKGAFDQQFKRWLNLSMGMSEATRETMRKMNPFKSYFNAGAFTEDRDDPKDQEPENDR